MGEHTIRPAHAEDAETIVSLIHELAAYEKLEHEAVAGPEAIRLHLFGDRPRAEAILAEVDGRPVGFALFFHNFSTFLGRPGMYLEDLFVRPEHRATGIGRALLTELAGIAADRGCGRLDWAVLDWNEPAQAFYKSIGAKPVDDWTIYRLDARAIAALSGGCR